MPKCKALLSWSSGKDSAWMLYTLQQDPTIELCSLVTTINHEFQRVAMHGVRRELLELQAQAADLPLTIIELPYPCSNADYESRMGAFVEHALADGIECMAFGDLFLEDIRRYREDKLANTGIQPIFPLWGQNTRQLAEQMLDKGLKAYLTCVDPTKLASRWAGSLFSAELLNQLPTSVDPCGEYGEFHTFAVDGPMFRQPITVRTGDIVERDGFVFADLLPDAE